MSEVTPNSRGRPKIYDDFALNDLARSLKQWVKDHSKEHKFGMLKLWCFENDFNPKYFKRYAEKNQDFKEAYEWAKEWQEYIVAHGAMTGTLNSRFCQFFLGCMHDWRTKEPNEDKLGTLRNEFGKYLDLMKEKDVTEPEDN